MQKRNDNIFENGRQPKLFLNKEDDLNFLKIEDDIKKIMQPKTIKSKNNGCCTAPGNLVF
jgi:hypothetical protein